MMAGEIKERKKKKTARQTAALREFLQSGGRKERPWAHTNNENLIGGQEHPILHPWKGRPRIVKDWQVQRGEAQTGLVRPCFLCLR